MTIRRVGGAHQRWLVTLLGEGNSNDKPMGRWGSSALVGNSPKRGEL